MFKQFNSKIVKRPLKSPPGFTLLEILITIFIFSIIVSTVFVSFNAVLSTASAVDKDILLYEMGKNCLDRIFFDLTQIYLVQPPLYRVPDIDDPPDPYRFVGDFSQAGGAGRLRFASLAHLPFGNRPGGGIAEIVYYLQETEEGEYVLKRKDSPEPFPPFEEKNTDPILCRQVRSLTFAYFNDEWESSEGWDSESDEFNRATPTAVKVRISLGDENRPLIMEAVVGLPMVREKIE